VCGGIVSATPERTSANGNASSAVATPVGVRTRSVVSGTWVLVTLAAAIFLATVVFVLLPGWLAPRPTPVPPIPAAVVAPIPARAPDAAEAVRERLVAEEAKARFEAGLQALRDQRAETWAAEDLAAAINLAATAAATLSADDLAGGARRYDEASGRLAAIAGRAESVYVEALARGAMAIEAGKQEQAVAAYRLAAAIHPDAEAARTGLARAERLDKVLALMNAGAARSQSGEWDAARGAYAEAAKLDPGYGPAKDALARVERDLAGQRFAQLISRGLARLDRSEWAEAEQAFRAAARLRPGDRSAAEGLARAQEGRERYQLTGMRSEGRQLESAERWSEALAVYRRALAVDPTLDFAKRGVELAERMVSLHAEFDALLAAPARLYSPRVREEARKVLAAADAAAAGGPRLAQTRARLDAALLRATTPIQVRLASDDATEVTLYRVGHLGRFQAREIELAPGTYTLVGSRAGYRDVQIKLNVDPGAPAPRVFIACKEPV
jgi:hypothetical protein